MLKNQNGFSEALVLLLVVIIGAVGFGGWRVYQAQNKTVNSTVSSSATEATKLAEIKDKVNALDHRTNTSYTYQLQVKVTDPALTVSVPPSFVTIFNGSNYANDSTIAPVGTSGSNGSGASQALSREKVDTILKQAGLSLISTDGTEPQVTLYYTSDLVACSVADSIGIAKVICSGQQAVQKTTSSVKDAFMALKSKYPDTKVGQYASASYTEKDNVKGVYFSDIDGLDKSMTGTAYVVNVSGTWVYVGSDTAAQGGSVSPGCAVIGKSEYKDVFIDHLGLAVSC